MSGALPQTVGFEAVNLKAAWNTAVDTSDSGVTQTAEKGAHQWRFTARWPQLTREEWAPIMGFLMAQRGRAGSFTVIPPHLATPLGEAGGTPVVNAPDVVNGGFDADTNWTKGTGWSIAAGVATHAPGATNSIFQAHTFTAGAAYQVTYTVSQLVAGTIQVLFGGGTTVFGAGRNGDGTYTQTLVAAAGNNIIQFSSTSNFDGSIDDVSIALYGGNVLPVDGATVTTSGWLKIGDVFKLAGHEKVYLVTADADTDGSGRVAVTFEPPLFHAPADDEALTVSSVPFTMGARGDVQEFPVQAPNLMTHELDLEERL